MAPVLVPSESLLRPDGPLAGCRIASGRRVKRNATSRAIGTVMSERSTSTWPRPSKIRYAGRIVTRLGTVTRCQQRPRYDSQIPVIASIDPNGGSVIRVTNSRTSS